jgi:hypothetical protein
MWYYAINNQQFGPVAENYLASLIQNKTVNDKTLVWKEGLPAWVALGQTELARLLAPAAPVPQPVALVAPAAYAQPAPQAGYPAPQAGYGYMPQPIMHSPQANEIIDITKWYWLILGFPFVMAILLWKSWEVLKDGFGRTTPFKALFHTAIPFYNFYWNFTSIHGLAIDMNNYLNRFNIPAPRLDAGVAQFLCIAYIGMVVPFLDGLAGIALIILAIMFANQLKNTLIAIYDYRAAQK